MKRLFSWIRETFGEPVPEQALIPIKEEDGRHKAWYEEARKQTLETLPEFVKRLATSYQHDYGTICHACAAAAVGAASAVERGPQGGITGFQGSAVMWEFITHWQRYEGPMRLVRYEQLLYPQNLADQHTLSRDTFTWLQQQAKSKLREKGQAHPDVVKHWEALAAGTVPEGYRLEAKP